MSSLSSSLFDASCFSPLEEEVEEEEERAVFLELRVLRLLRARAVFFESFREDEDEEEAEEAGADPTLKELSGWGQLCASQCSLSRRSSLCARVS